VTSQFFKRATRPAAGASLLAALLACCVFLGAAQAADTSATTATAATATASSSASASASASTSAAPAAAAVATPAVPATAAPAVAATPNKGDTAWMLMSTALVLLMSVPALALFYGGLVRQKNMLSVLIQVFVVFSLITVLWAAYGYSLAFTEGNRFIGGFSRLFLNGTFNPLTGDFSRARSARTRRSTNSCSSPSSRRSRRSRCA
jgi:Amt family ammonium transporter